MDFHKFWDTPDHEHIRLDILKSFEKFGIDSTKILSNVTFTSDNCPALVKALDGFERLYDVMHGLNLLAKRTTTPYKKNYLPQEFDLPQDIRDELEKLRPLLKTASVL